MDKRKKILPILLVCAMVCLLAACGVMGGNSTTPEEPAGIVDWATLHAYGDGAEEHTRIDVQTIGDENVLVLPATVSPEAVSLCFEGSGELRVFVTGDLGRVQIRSGEPFDLTALCGEGAYTLKLEDGDSEYALKLFFADHIGTMYLVS